METSRYPEDSNGHSEYDDQSFLEGEPNPNYDEDLRATAIDDKHLGLMIEERAARKDLLRWSQDSEVTDDDYLAARKRLEDAHAALDEYLYGGDGTSS